MNFAALESVYALRANNDRYQYRKEAPDYGPPWVFHSIIPLVIILRYVQPRCSVLLVVPQYSAPLFEVE